MDKYSITDFENVLCIRNQLVFVPIERLLEVYSDRENFITFLDTFRTLIDVDSAFMLFSDEICEKAKRVINENRFNYKDSEEDKKINEVINFIIGYLNEIKGYSDELKNELMDIYLAYQEECRKVEMEDTQILLESLGYDALAYCALKENNMEIVDSDDMFLASVNYMIEAMPEVFENTEMCDRLVQKLDEISHKKGLLKNKATRKHARETQENFQKIK